MENSYCIGISNRYMLALDDDADPFEVLKIQEEANLKQKAAAKKDAKDAKGKGSKAAPKKGRTGIFSNS